jgi:hypothetical protein
MDLKTPSRGQSTSIAEKIWKRLAEFGGTQVIASRDYEPRLLQSPLFEGCGDDQIWNKHARPQKALSCSDRGALVRTLADALIKYELLIRLAQSIPQKVQQDKLTALELFNQKLALARRPRPERALTFSPQAKAKKPRQSGLEKAVDLVAQAVRDFPLEHDARFTRRLRSQAYTHLLNVMSNAFVTYGPSGKYSQSALHFAIATILLHFDVVKVDASGREACERVAERIRKKVCASRTCAAE